MKGYFFIDDDPQAPADSSVILQQFPAQPFAQAYRKFPGNLLSAAGGEISQFAASSRDDSKPGSLLLSRVKYAAGLAAILFTSGSAGVPKAVGLTHEQLYWGNQNLRDGFEYSTADTEIVVAPLTHIGGFNGTTLDLFSHGGTVVIMREFDPQKLLAQIERYRAAMMFGVPTIYAAMLNHPDFSKRDLSSFRLPLIGGAPAAASLLNRMAAAGLRPINVWGMTETSASGCCLSSENALRAVGSIGVPFPRIAARVVDPATGLDAENGVGELLLCGPSVITEYWNNPEATERAFIGQWLRTGDLVRVDSDGNFWVTGRIHNLINTGGEKVAPEEVERILSEYPGVSECTVVGIPDERWGEAIAAAFVMQAGKKLPSLPELRDFAAGKLAGYKIPKFVCELPEFPSTPNGKVDRAALAEILGKS
ncbi:AMP-binding protein [Arcanobacterium hippocoleae]